MQPVLFYGVPQGSSFGSIVALEWLGQPYQLCCIEMLQQPWNPLYVEYHQLFDLQQRYPYLHRYLQTLKSDPAVRCAEAIENQQVTKTSGNFMGHIALEQLRAASQIPQGSRLTTVDPSPLVA